MTEVQWLTSWDHGLPRDVKVQNTKVRQYIVRERKRKSEREKGEKEIEKERWGKEKAERGGGSYHV